MKAIINNKYIRVTFLIILGVLLGWLIKPSGSKHDTENDEHAHATHKETQIWTCSMHPQIRRSQPGQCPICGMDLIPLSSASQADANPLAITMSPTAMQLADVQTTVVSRRKPVKEVRLIGKVEADERKIYSQASHIPGRIEQLMINYTGEQIQKGQVLAFVYSPELITAQEELFEAMKVKDQQPLLYDAAREKLRNWKLTDQQIEQIISGGKPKEKFPVLADISGVVLRKRVNTGDYIMKGMSIYDVVDLSTVWVLFDVYESDMSWIKTGSKVSFTIASMPGETFSGMVSFIDPVIDPQTRVAKARVVLPNPGLKLKPEMFATGLVKSELHHAQEGLAIPATAVMWTGKRSVVYVKSNTTDAGISFMMREVTLGPSLGDSYMVEDGLEEGEEIATNGTFSIDAAAQLAGKPSMMNPDGGPAMTGHEHMNMKDSTTNAHAITISKKTKRVLAPLFEKYLSLKNALVADDYDKSKEEAASLSQDLSKVSMHLFSGSAHSFWMEHSKASLKALREIDKASDIGGQRRGFKLLSDHMIMMAVTFGPFNDTLYIEHCPMANDNKGADWISSEQQIRNPYFGKSMIGCGSVMQEIK